MSCEINSSFTAACRTCKAYVSTNLPIHPRLTSLHHQQPNSGISTTSTSSSSYSRKSMQLLLFIQQATPKPPPFLSPLTIPQPKLNEKTRMKTIFLPIVRQTTVTDRE